MNACLEDRCVGEEYGTYAGAILRQKTIHSVIWTRTLHVRSPAQRRARLVDAGKVGIEYAVRGGGARREGGGVRRSGAPWRRRSGLEIALSGDGKRRKVGPSSAKVPV